MTSPIIAALNAATQALSPVSDTARLDAELLLAFALGIERDALLLGKADALPVPPDFAALLARRMAHEPMAYILGERDFWTLTLAVGPGVLIPRPDSETLIEVAIKHRADTPPRQVLDLGTGSGALLLAALDHWRGATGMGIDRSPMALDYARRNAIANDLQDRADFRIGDWCDGLDQRFDLILCNPPYVEDDAALSVDVRDHEPASALFAGVDGLDDYQRLIPQLRDRMTDSGLAILEIGWTQAVAVSTIARTAGFRTEIHRDLAGRDRAIALFPCNDGPTG